MIESYTKIYWLEEIQNSCVFLENLYRKQEWNNNLEFQFEKSIFFGFYAIRKLIESNLIDPNIASRNTKITKYSPIEKEEFEINFLERWSKAYNLMKGDEWQLSLEKICNQFVHSKIYSPFVPDGTWCVGIYFVSDRDYKKKVYYIQLIRVIETFLSVCHGKSISLNLGIDEENTISIKNIGKYT
ncbi:hypothetical protein Q4490_15935 [Neptunomonas phycophila]|uniref:Uncharacterized protein n=1 Tax=Neptunomonas phycophila TaxID=1572645 RepID=A0AAW7XPY8_9GAMM|nr:MULTISPECIES: hypothetical protein [Neptunomonas]MDN2658204.1 hypothetical protein [Neptunomonas sp. CHC150]MDO6455062.1 hypothetical protein [Neptunomonas phycophila]